MEWLFAREAVESPEFAAGPDGLEVICIGGKKPEGNDASTVDGFWD